MQENKRKNVKAVQQAEGSTIFLMTLQGIPKLSMVCRRVTQKKGTIVGDEGKWRMVGRYITEVVDGMDGVVDVCIIIIKYYYLLMFYFL